MRLLGINFEGPGHWPLALPPLLLIAFLAGLFLLATQGQSRLEMANVRVQRSDLRERQLGELLAVMVDAESAQRGFLISGNDNDLRPYARSLSRTDLLLNEIRLNYQGDDASLTVVRHLRLSVGKKLGELDSSLALAKAQGSAVAMDLMRTGAGRRYMEDVRADIDVLRSGEAAERRAATERWHRDLRLSRWITGAGALLNIILVLVAARLVFLDMRRRSEQAAELQRQKALLEEQVAERTAELTALSTHLQEISEQEKYALSRELHDELGGLLVSARMDLSWLERKLPTDDPAVTQRFRRIQESLTAGVNLKRRVVEELRPTLLDNMGLFAALRWQVKEACTRSGLKCTERYPEEELQLLPQAAIAIFRTVQEALTNILKHAGATSFDVEVETHEHELVLQISDDGRGLSADRLKSLGSHGLAAMRHRIESLGGRFKISNLPSGGALVAARVPLDRILDSARRT
jgi:signal transduction histidine kinase